MAICCVCMKEYPARVPKQQVCSIPCSLQYVAAKRQAEKAKAQRAADRKRKQALKSKSELANDAQVEFNRYIRSRDEHLPCVSCGRHHAGQYHAGHYRSRGAASQLRFNVFNTHKQCQPCNNHLSGNLAPYREELLRRIGEDRVLALENNNELANYSREYLARLRQVFRKRTAHLKKLRARLATRDDNF